MAPNPISASVITRPFHLRTVEESLNMGMKEEGCAAVIDGLEKIGLDFFIHIPDSYGAPVIEHFQERTAVKCFSVAREEEGIGVAAGMTFSGKKAVLFCQDVGLGNSMVALTTFAMAYHVPMLILAIRRGGFGEFNSAVHNFSEHAIHMVEAMNVKAFVLDYRVPTKEWPQAIERAYEYTHLTHRPVVVFLNLKE